MKTGGALQVTTPSEREIALTRVFHAPRRLVWEAHTKPELVKKWCFGPDGWSLVVCEIDLRVGGRFRYVWQHAEKPEMGMGGEYREIVPQSRIVNTEQFDQAWYSGDAVVTTTFEERGGKTTLTCTILYDTKEIRDAVLKSPMKDGMELGYDRLEALLAA